MPADTSIGLSQDTRDQLDDYRAAGHESMEDVIAGLLKMVPPADDILHDGACAWDECDSNLWVPDTPEERGGVIQWASTDYDGQKLYNSTYYCSVEHAAKNQDKIDEMAAGEPDEVKIGGADEITMSLTMDGMRLHHGHPHELGIDAPLDLVGEDRHGYSYDYHGEPIEVINGGKVRFSGEITDMLREETYTAIKFRSVVPGSDVESDAEPTQGAE